MTRLSQVAQPPNASLANRTIPLPTVGVPNPVYFSISLRMTLQEIQRYRHKCLIFNIEQVGVPDRFTERFVQFSSSCCS